MGRRQSTTKVLDGDGERKKKIIEDLKKTTWTHICRSMFQLLKTSNEEKTLKTEEKDMLQTEEQRKNMMVDFALQTI